MTQASCLQKDVRQRHFLILICPRMDPQQVSSHLLHACLAHLSIVHQNQAVSDRGSKPGSRQNIQMYRCPRHAQVVRKLL